MKIDADTSGELTTHRPDRVEASLIQELRPRLVRLAEMAKILQAKVSNDDTARDIFTTALELLDVINRESVALPPILPSTATGPCDVLCIDDNSTYFEAIDLLLRDERGLKLLQATDGQEGIALAQSRRPRLILLDLGLPDMHGSEVLLRLQKSPATSAIPIVVISGDATPSEIERLLVLGARNYITKPFRVEPFLAVVDEALEENATSLVS